MSKEAGKFCLMMVSAGEQAATEGEYSITPSGSKLFFNHGTLPSAFTVEHAVGDQLRITGFAGGELIAIVKAIGNVSGTEIGDVIYSATREPAVITSALDNPASTLVNYYVDHFVLVGGQKSASYTISSDQIDLSDKVSNHWGEYAAGKVSMTASVSGNISWPDTAGWQVLMDALGGIVDPTATGRTVNCRLKMNKNGDSIYAPFFIQSGDGGGELDGATTYSFGLSAISRPVFAKF